MELLRRLHSILMPGTGPANRAGPAGATGVYDRLAREVLERTEREVESVATAVRQQTGAVGPGVAPAALSGAGEASNAGAAANGTAAGPAAETPTVSAEDGVLPARGEAQPATTPEPEVPAAALETRIGSAVREVAQSMAQAAAQRSGAVATTPTMGSPASTTAASSGTAPAVMLNTGSSLLPLLPLVGSGASGYGINGTTEGLLGTLQLKHAQYTNPGAHGVADIGPEGRMFLEAVDRGLVANTPEGLGNLLAHLGLGRADRHPGATTFFDQWFAATRSV